MNPEDLIIYGTSWVLVGSAIMFVVNYILKLLGGGVVTVELDRLLKAGWSALGLFVLTKLPSLELLWPDMSTTLPLVFGLILMFAGQLGFSRGTAWAKLRGLLKGE